MKCLLCERHYKKTPHVFEYYMVNIQEPLFLPQQINIIDKENVGGWYVYTQWNIIQPLEKKILPLAKKKWMELEGIMLGEINQAEKDTV